MDTAEPAGITLHSYGRATEPKLGLSASLMGETILSKVPKQQCQLVLSPFEIWGEIHLVEITVRGVGASLELAFEHDHLAIDPQPVLTVHGYPRRNALGDALEVEVLPESYPFVRSVRSGISRSDCSLGIQDYILRSENGIYLGSLLVLAST